MIQSFQGNQIKIQGRTVQDGGMLWLCSPLSEAGFRVKGATSVKLVLRADDTVSDPERYGIRPKYIVRLDGEAVRPGTCMEREEETVTVFDGSAPKDAEVRLIKLSECTQSLMALKEIVTDGAIEPLPDKALKIEFIGDSITCGYGVETDDPEEGFTTATENAEKSYAAFLSDALDADRNLTAFSGHGIVSGYTDNPEKQNCSELVPPYYESAGRNGFRLPSGRIIEDIPWDFSAYQPQQIVINLGTNDLSWCMEYSDRKAEYSRLYTEFLKTVRKHNPGARIFCILGVMGTALNTSMAQAVEKYRNETGDGYISFHLLDEQDPQDGYGANYHPSEATQRKLADIVIKVISG